MESSASAAAAAAAAQPSLVTTTLLVVAIVFPILGTIAVGLRCYTRIIKKQRLSSDDWVCVLAQVAAWGISIDIFVAGGLAGVDFTYSTLDPLSAAVIFLRALWIEGFPLVFSLVFVKIAILLFYSRIFTTRMFKLAVRIYIGILSAWCIAMIVCQLLAANPIDAAWNPLAVNPLRYNYNDFSLAFAGMSIVFDVIVLLFPIPVIRKLQMDRARKLQVLGIFWLGIFCCISSAVRFYYLYKEISRTIAATGSDRYLNMSAAFIWGTIEPNTSIVAACLPCYAPLFAKVGGLPTLLANFGSLFSSSRGSRAKARNGSDLLASGDSAQSLPLIEFLVFETIIRAIGITSTWYYDA
ncbi:hypothetical protein BBK36DRAFT_160704 [Trichoderma citrinoviride]|uniref:Rhodopsin domain-containing protein n=1 Tax=Trichoderma citrinoviride TaxID=58853 RepID=A0A2T4BCD0_9HYPO|nr:hypothetical protein BBK36DRAFT_160704 [Trichoderma citrinoviride]PTB66984.1 hypothetical protein BBK36DRAFT_160704 [Trichoderma citrinoviride]